MYLVVGRCSDEENYHKLVVAMSPEEAEEKLEAYVRDDCGILGGDFYVDHCAQIGDMVLNAIN